MEELNIDQKLEELEQLLIDQILKKAREQEPLNSSEMQLVVKWLQNKNKKPTNKPVEPTILKGEPLPFLNERLPFSEAVDALEEVM